MVTSRHNTVKYAMGNGTEVSLPNRSNVFLVENIVDGFYISSFGGVYYLNNGKYIKLFEFNPANYEKSYNDMGGIYLAELQKVFRAYLRLVTIETITAGYPILSFLGELAIMANDLASYNKKADW